MDKLVSTQLQPNMSMIDMSANVGVFNKREEKGKRYVGEQQIWHGERLHVKDDNGREPSVFLNNYKVAYWCSFGEVLDSVNQLYLDDVIKSSYEDNDWTTNRYRVMVQVNFEVSDNFESVVGDDIVVARFGRNHYDEKLNKTETGGCIITSANPKAMVFWIRKSIISLLACRVRHDINVRENKPQENSDALDFMTSGEVNIPTSD